MIKDLLPGRIFLDCLFFFFGSRVIHIAFLGKSDNIVFCPLTELQKKVYARILEQPDCKRVLEMIKDKSAIDLNLMRKEGNVSPLFFSPRAFSERAPRMRWRLAIFFSHSSHVSGSHFAVFPLITHLLHVASHVQLLEPHSKDKAIKKKEQLYYDTVLGDDKRAVLASIKKSGVEVSGKLKTLKPLMAAWWKEKKKVSPKNIRISTSLPYKGSVVLSFDTYLGYFGEICKIFRLSSF